MPTVETKDPHPKQAAFLDLTGEQFNLNYVDPDQPLFVANYPDHFKAHKLQVLLDRMDKQLENKPSAFNATAYKQVLDDLIESLKKIRADAKRQNSYPAPAASQALDSGAVAGALPGSDNAGVSGEHRADGLDPRVSAQNPFSR